MTQHASAAAAQWLAAEHAARRDFKPLAGALLPASMAQAYDTQDALVAMRIAAGGGVRAGFKIALTTPAMRRFVGYDDSIAGQVLAGGIHHSPATVSSGRYQHLLFECELAFRLGTDVAPGMEVTRDLMSNVIDAVCPAFELADDRHADYAKFSADGGATLRTLAADNAWNSGVVLGTWVLDWRSLDLGAVRGVASVNGAAVGEGFGRDVLGHPLDAMVWVTSHLHARGVTLKRGEFVITGSLITSKFPQVGDRVVFTVDGLGTASMTVGA